LSIAHLEFRRAGTSHISRVALLRTSVPDTDLSDVENPDKAPLIRAFRNEVQDAVRAARFADLAGLLQALRVGRVWRRLPPLPCRHSPKRLSVAARGGAGPSPIRRRPRAIHPPA
jgi:hypothetical protein